MKWYHFVFLFIFLSLVGAITYALRPEYFSLDRYPILQQAILFVTQNFEKQTPLGVMLFFFLGGLAALPSPVPQELAYIYIMNNPQQPQYLLYLMTLGAMVCAQVANYGAGLLLGFWLRKNMESQLQTVQGLLNHVGILFIFIIHVLPFFSSFVNVATGIAKYSFTKWFFSMLAGIAVYLLLLVLVFDRWIRPYFTF